MARTIIPVLTRPKATPAPKLRELPGSPELRALQELIGIIFRNPVLLRIALTHKSYLNERRDVSDHNERLEFLGDAVLEIVVTERLYRTFPRTAEGDLTNCRANLVNAKILATVARELGLEPYILMSRGETKAENSKAREFIMANAFEALIGAIYLDRGLGLVELFIDEYLWKKFEEVTGKRDPKSHFQELAQERFGITPIYKVIGEEGPDHDRTYTMQVHVSEKVYGQGTGSSKKEAEMAAASDALQKEFSVTA